MREQDLTLPLRQQVQHALKTATPLAIVGGNSKAFYGGDCRATERLQLAEHCGVIDYEPSELVITARSGTTLAALDALLARHGQMLAFEPPRFGEQSTIGGALACGFSGPRRPFAGSARDFTLGCKIINGHGEVLSFGGRVMKNVAGFDVSRLMVGALGTLGVLLEVSLKVLPLPEYELTLVQAMTVDEALPRMAGLMAQPWPLSALAHDGRYLRIRLSGAQTAVAAAARRLGGDSDNADESFWKDLREQRLAFFARPGALWRVSLAPATPMLPLSGDWFIDWGGGLRWLKTDQPAAAIHQAIARSGGHAVCFRGVDKSDWLRLEPALQALQEKVRAAFDPAGLFNPGRLAFKT